MRKVILILIVLISNYYISDGQSLDPKKYGLALSKLTTYADLPGFKEEVIIEEEDGYINWESTEDDFVYTEDIDNIEIFAFNTVSSTDDIFIVNIYYSSTGTAELSYLMKVQALDNKLILKEIIAGGDRCQKGVKDVKVEDDTLFYSHYITTHHLMTWGNNEINDYLLHNCMVCCIGFVRYKYDLKSSTNEFSRLVLIEEYLPNDKSIQRAYKK